MFYSYLYLTNNFLFIRSCETGPEIWIDNTGHILPSWEITKEGCYRRGSKDCISTAGNLWRWDTEIYQPTMWWLWGGDLDRTLRLWGLYVDFCKKCSNQYKKGKLEVKDCKGHGLFDIFLPSKLGSKKSIVYGEASRQKWFASLLAKYGESE